jgi:hypothetical protein
MNKEAIELVKQYILATVSGDNSISKDAYELLTHMLQADRSLATELYDIYDQIESSGIRYQIPVDYNDGELSDDEGYEH